MLRRSFEVVLGVSLIGLGVVMFVTPGPGIAVVIAGVMLVSPQHGRRLIWYLAQVWRRAKAYYHKYYHGRVRVFQRVKKFKLPFKK